MTKNITFILKIILAFCAFIILSWFTYLALTYLLEDVVKTMRISSYGLLVESGVLILFLLFFYILCRRLMMAFIITCLLYLAFIISSYIKIRMLDSPIYPADFAVIGDLLRTWSVVVEYIPYILIFLIISFLSLRLLYKKEPAEPNSTINRLFAAAVLVLAATATFQYNESIRLTLKSFGIFDKKSANLTKRGLKNGLLSSFTQVLLFPANAPKPDGYSEKRIQQIITKYGLDVATDTKTEQAKHVIILMIESFSNPQDFGWQFTEEPIPNFLKATSNHTSGHVFSPVFGGRSVNAEFEFMTGFTNRFIPNQTNPYHEFVSRDITGLPRVFKNNGYTTHAIQAVFFEGFGYEKVYDYIGVDHKISMTTEVNGYKPDPSGRSIDSAAIADQIISLTQAQNKSFIFTFPNSTHTPWMLAHYPNTHMVLTDKNHYSDRSYDSISAFGNALFHVDQMIGQLITYFSQSDDKTMIVVFGDHQPVIARLRTDESKFTNFTPLINDKLNKYQTPLLIWTNYASQNKQNFNTSLNLLPGIIIEEAGVTTKGLMKFNQILSQHFQVFSDFIQQKDQFSIDAPINTQQIYKDYQLLQYDALFGENFLYKNITHH